MELPLDFPNLHALHPPWGVGGGPKKVLINVMFLLKKGSNGLSLLFPHPNSNEFLPPPVLKPVAFAPLPPPPRTLHHVQLDRVPGLGGVVGEGKVVEGAWKYNEVTGLALGGGRGANQLTALVRLIERRVAISLAVLPRQGRNRRQIDPLMGEAKSPQEAGRGGEGESTHQEQRRVGGVARGSSPPPSFKPPSPSPPMERLRPALLGSPRKSSAGPCRPLLRTSWGS